MKKYVEAELEIVNLLNSDIITTSGGITEDGDNDVGTGVDPW